MDGQDGGTRRRVFSPEMKLRAIQEARQGGVPVSRVCEKYGIRPAQFYAWEKQAEQGAGQAARAETVQPPGKRNCWPRSSDCGR